MNPWASGADEFQASSPGGSKVTLGPALFLPLPSGQMGRSKSGGTLGQETSV